MDADTNTIDDGEGSVKALPSFSLPWFSAHLGPVLDRLWEDHRKSIVKQGDSRLKVHFTVVKPGTRGARVVIVNPENFAIYRIMTLETALNLEPLVIRPTASEHIELNAVLSRISHLLT